MSRLSFRIYDPVRPALLLLLLLPALAMSASADDRTGDPTSDRTVYLRGGHLVDVDRRTIERADLLIVDGVVAGRPDAPPADFAGTIVDAEGAFILPGLRDLHVHSPVQTPPSAPPDFFGSDGAARRMLRVGVTGSLDLFNVEGYIFALRDAQRRAGADCMADIYAAGPCLTATDGHCTEYGLPTRIVDSPADAARHLAELAPLAPDVVKIVYEHDSEGYENGWRPARPTLDLPTLRATITAAHEHGLRTVVHIRSWRDIREAAEAGTDAVTHLPSLPIPGDMAALLAERGTVVIPTLSVGDTIFATEPERLDDPVTRLVTGERIVAAYLDFDTAAENNRPLMRGLAEAQKVRAAALRALEAAGVTLVAGTDAGNPWTVHGVSLHRELEMMADAGLDPWRVLASATTEAGRFLGRSWGLDEGDQGSLLVLDASPIDDVRNTRRLRAVVHHGRVVDLEALGRDIAQRPFPSPQSAMATDWATFDRAAFCDPPAASLDPEGAQP